MSTPRFQEYLFKPGDLLVNKHPLCVSDVYLVLSQLDDPEKDYPPPILALVNWHGVPYVIYINPTTVTLLYPGKP